VVHIQKSGEVVIYGPQRRQHVAKASFFLKLYYP